MPIVSKDFSNGRSVSGIWKISETEEELLEIYTPGNLDLELLQKTSSEKRKREILATRALIKKLGLNIIISYNGRRPVSNKGYISISHSFDFVCVIWHPEKKVTIDIEKISNRILNIAKRAFSEYELNFAGNNLKDLTILWNCKECIFKLANDDGIEFKEQIRVHPFGISDTIQCDLYNHKNTVKFNFNWSEIEDYTYVWGII